MAETWGLRLPDGRITEEGYSQRPLRSAEDVRRDFDSSLFDTGAKPVLLRRTYTENFEATSESESSDG